MAQVELQTGKGSVQAIEEATRVKFRQASVTGDYPQAAKLPRHHDVAMVDTCAERVLFLKKLLECEDGIEMMSHHASGIKGMLLHGPGSCLAGAMVRCCAAQCEPRDLTLGPPALTHRLSGKFY